MRRFLRFFAILGLGVAGLAGAEETAADRVLARLRALAGDWKGSLEWTGARTGTGSVRAIYRVTGNGSAVVEDLLMGSDDAPSMTSVYHVDGADVRMTHFCGAQNQPRLKADRVDEARGVAHFSMVDATGLAAHPAHVREVEIRFLGEDRLVLEFTFEGAGKTSLEHIELARAGPAAAKP